MPIDTFLSVIHRALQCAAEAHRNQNRKGSETPYISHPATVGFLLQRAGFDEETIAAAILHDVVEDTDVKMEYLRREFGPWIAELVDWLSEQKTDAGGEELPWEHRKQHKFERLHEAPVEAKAIALADKLHNLYSILVDERAGIPVWSRFKAAKERWLWNAARVVEVCGGDDPRLQELAAGCRRVLAELEKG